MPHSQHTPPSAWIDRHLRWLPTGGRILDLACGNGRHTRLLLDRGFRVCAVDRQLNGISDLALNPRVDLLEHDLEANAWPFASSEFSGILVSNYLHRPLFPVLQDSLTPGGVLLYETFARGNERYGRPSNPEFLLRPGELRHVFASLLCIDEFEELTETHPRPAVRQRLLARNPKNAPVLTL